MSLANYKANTACKIAGRLWRIVFRSLSSAWGYCEHDSRTILIEKNADAQTVLDAICHEVAHASFPYLTEDTIGSFGTDLARLLWKMGWRPTK